MKKCLTFLLGALFSIGSFAEETLKDNYNVQSIEILENSEVPEEVLTNLMGTKIGDKFSTEKLISDYNKIIKEGYAEELSIFPKIFDGGVKVVVQIKEKKDVKKYLVIRE